MIPWQLWNRIKKKKNIFRDKTNFKTFATQRNSILRDTLYHPIKNFPFATRFQIDLFVLPTREISPQRLKSFPNFENCILEHAGGIEKDARIGLKCRARSRARSRNEPSNFVSAIFVRFIARFRERKPTVSLGACSRWLTHNVTAPREKERADHACVIDSLANILHDTCTCTSRDATVGLLWSRIHGRDPPLPLESIILEQNGSK